MCGATTARVPMRAVDQHLIIGNRVDCGVEPAFDLKRLGQARHPQRETISRTAGRRNNPM